MALLVAGTAAADTIRLGRGLGPWTIGMRLKTAPGLQRTERHPERAGPGCTLGAATAPRIDYYPGLRLSWQNGRLTNVATRRAGDRSGDGFTVGTSRFPAVRKAHPRARISRRAGRYNLGRTALVIVRKTGYEAWKDFTYWFDARGVLRALETGEGGC